MSSHASTGPVRGRHANDRSNIYQDITSTIIAELEAGRLPWVQPWGSPGVPAALGMPRNAATGRPYSGINVLMLWVAVAEHGFPVQSWLTFKQALALGGAQTRARHNRRLRRSVRPRRGARAGARSP
jgi:antirestriction protein ArdC